MSTAARKARKRAGIRFQHPVKTPTPLEQRHRFEFMAPKRAEAEMTIRGFEPGAIAIATKRLVGLRTQRAFQRRLAGRH